MRPRTALAALLASVLGALALVSCSGGAADPGGSGGAAGQTGSGGARGHLAPTVRFDPGTGAVPRFLDVPFPSDAYLEADGTLVDAIPGLADYFTSNADGLSQMLAGQRGFSLTGGAFFRLDWPDPDHQPTPDATSFPKDEAASIASDAPAFLVDLDGASGPEIVPSRLLFHDGGGVRPSVLAVLPARGVVLAEGHRHVAGLTTRLTAGGSPIEPADAFRALRDDGKAGGSSAAKTALGALTALEKLPGFDRSRVSAVAVFTTQKAADELLGMRTLVAAKAPPVVHWDAASVAPMAAAFFTATTTAGATATLDDWLGTPQKLPDGSDDPARDQPNGAAHDAIAAIATGVYDSPSFLRVKPNGYQDLEHATVARDASGKPMLDPDHPTAKVWVSIALPKGAVPTSGWPVVIVQHGLGGDRSFLLSLANTFAKQGFATVAIEAVTFGARAVDPQDTVDAASRFAWSSKAAYHGPDGFVDQQALPTALFGDVYNFGAARDQLRQTVIDLGTLADVVSDPSLDLGPLTKAVPGAKLDSTRIGYAGDSFGAIAGAMLAAVDTRIRGFLLNVGGGGIATELVANGPYLASIVGTVASLAFGISGDRLDAAHPFMGILQTILDPADPLTHARRVLTAPAADIPAKSVVLVEAIWDEIVPNEGTEALARAMGLFLATPNVGTNAGVPFTTATPVNGILSNVPAVGLTGVLVQASPGTHGSDLYDAKGVRHFAIPFGKDPSDPFPVLPADLPVVEPYLGLQAMSAGFFSSLFAGGPGKAPEVSGFPVPVRDFDGDGVEDSVDPDPLDPAKN